MEMDSAFGKWFDAQFPNDGRFDGVSDEALSDLAEDGRDAEQELLRRKIRREQERAALYAWQAAPQVTQYPASDLTEITRGTRWIP
jgi:hypothetical protein